MAGKNGSGGLDKLFEAMRNAARQQGAPSLSDPEELGSVRCPDCGGEEGVHLAGVLVIGHTNKIGIRFACPNPLPFQIPDQVEGPEKATSSASPLQYSIFHCPCGARFTIVLATRDTRVVTLLIREVREEEAAANSEEEGEEVNAASS